MITFSFLDRMLNVSSQIRIKHQTLRKKVLYMIESKINHYRDILKLIILKDINWTTQSSC